MNIVIILLQILGILIGLYLAFFKSYFTEKGKNLATSEDIEELTTKVESVKEKFAERNSALKARLDLLTNMQIGHINEERNAIMNFLKAFSNFQSLCFDYSFGGLDTYNNAELSKYRIELDVAYNQIRITKSILKVFIDDDELYTKSNELIKVLINMDHNFKNSIINLNLNNLKIENLDRSLANVNLEKEHEDLLAERKVINDKLGDAIENIISNSSFFDDLNEFHKVIRKNLTKSIN